MTGFSGSLNFTGVARLVENAAVGGVRDAAEAVLVSAKGKAPVQTGALRDSGSVAVDGMVAAVGFSDAKAVAAHENLNARLRNGKQAKFLELALVENADDALRAMSEAIKRALS